MKVEYVVNSELSFGGKQRVTQRIDTCGCGCQGQDPWHARYAKRVIKDVVILDQPHYAKTGWAGGGLVNVCAVGTYKHPSGVRQCALTIARATVPPTGEQWHIVGWQWIDEDFPVKPGTREEL